MHASLGSLVATEGAAIVATLRLASKKRAIDTSFTKCRGRLSSAMALAGKATPGIGRRY
jgi:hypothetical protein